MSFLAMITPTPDYVAPEYRRRPEWASRCCRCIAVPATIYVKTITRDTAEPGVYPKAGAVVVDTQFCLHHADQLDYAVNDDLSPLEAAGWTLVRDRREALRATESPAA